MTRPAVLAPAARLEFQQAARWLARRNPDAARKLRQATADAARLLGSRPLVGRQQSELVGPHYRLWSLSSFPYVLVYDPRAVPPQILRFLHTARDLPPLLAELREPPDVPGS
jgi:toxin ParE1/3/4